MNGSELKLGVVDQSPVSTGSSAADAVRETIALAREAERLGLSRIWLAEHHSTNSFAGSCPEVLIPAVAGATSRIRVGSGGVLLPHYSPLKVAEQFRMLETLFPGRIDLGVGRAPGGDPRTALAIQYGRQLPIDHFPEQLAELQRWVTNSYPKEHPWGRVRAMPRGEASPELWLLGSGGATARLAAELGAGYAFAQFISGEDGAERVAAYRDAFRSTDASPHPRALLAVGVVCAETDREAGRLAASLELWRRRIMRGRDRGIPSPEEALAELGEGWTAPDPHEPTARVVAGDPPTVAAALTRMAERYGVSEVLAVTVTHDYRARLRSYQLLAAELGIPPRSAEPTEA
jgi:luciferase family oxidoreductase group 1